MSRAQLLTIVIAVAAPIWVVGQTSNFMGGTPAAVDAAKVRTTRLRFPKGSRSNWHSHTWGQRLMPEECAGRAQARGARVMDTKPGHPWPRAAGFEPWCAPAPDQDRVQLAFYEG